MTPLWLALRPKQWVKNLLLFLPLTFGKKLFVFPDNLKTAAAFFLFSLAASAAYLVNDLLDSERDRRHPHKRRRPIASGALKPKQAARAAFLIWIAAILLSFRLDTRFGWIISIYCLLNYAYTKFLKNVVIIDVFCIGGFFLLRIAGGSAASDVALSHWILLMTVLLALFLGFNKRRQELGLLDRKTASARDVLGQYNTYFIDQMVAVVTSSIVVAYLLYSIDPRTVQYFGTGHLLYGIPFVYYGIFRYLYLVHRLGAQDDPTHLLLSDRPMQVTVVLWVLVSIAVIYFGL